MKLNWGTGILIFIIFFFIAIFSFVYFTTTHDINLVEQGYYPKGLEYDVQQDKMKNTAMLEEKLVFTRNQDAISIRFPSFTRSDTVKGSIYFYRPSDYHKDLTFPIALDTACIQHIGTTALLPGKYIIKVDWSHMNKSYYQEEIYIH